MRRLPSSTGGQKPPAPPARAAHGPRSLAGASAALSLVLAAGCGSKGEDPAPARPSNTGAVTAAAGGFAAKPTPAAAGESFFAGDVPAGVTLKPTKSFAIAPGVLLISGIEGWSGGKLPGYDYMATNKDSTVVGRVTTSAGVTGEMGCKEISTAAAMAPLRAKNLQEVTPATLRKVGKNGFVAREGVCSADGPKGPVQIHFINILRKDKDGFWHYAVLVGFPKDASPVLRNEAMAWARSLEYNGENGFKMP